MNKEVSSNQSAVIADNTPTATSRNYSNIPQELKDLVRWVVYRIEDKRPLRAIDNKPASVTNPDDWTDFKTACEVAEEQGTGIGFVFTKEDPFCGIDLDDCIKDGSIEPWAQKEVDRFASYTEFSPSRRGLHIIIKATLPKGRKNGNKEAYSEGRYFTMTGGAITSTPITSRQGELDSFIAEHFPANDTPSQVLCEAVSHLSDDELLRKASEARNSKKFNKLYFDGDGTEYASASEVDLALCNMLSFWTQDPKQIDRLFRKSGLMRDKWDSNRGDSTYGQDTIRKALSDIKETYAGNRDSSDVQSVEICESLISTPVQSTIIRPFSVELIPESSWLRRYIDFVSPLTEAPAQYHFASALSIVATALYRNVWLDFGSFYIYPNLYILVIGKSGYSRKSTAINMVKLFVNKVDDQAEMGQLTSLEAVYDALYEHPNRLCLYDEFKLLFENEAKKYGNGLVTLLTSVYACPTDMRVALKSVPKEKSLIKLPCVNLLTATTAEWLQVSENSVEGGFLPRFLFISADDSDVRCIPIPPPMDMKRFDGLVNELKHISTLKGIFTFTPEARGIYEGLYREIRQSLANEEDKLRMSAFYSRMSTSLLKLAMIFKVTSGDKSFLLDRDVITRSYMCMEQFRDFYRHVLTTLDFSPDQKQERQCLEAIKAAGQGGILRHEIMRKCHLTKRTFERAIETLVDKALVIEKPGEKKRGKKYVYAG